MISSQRPLFDIPESVAYLNCAAKAPMLMVSKRAGLTSLENSLHPWNLHPKTYFADSETARRLFAKLIHATADDVAIIPSTSYGITLAARNVKIRKGKTILIVEDEFPSNVYPWRAIARERSAKIVMVPRPSDYDWTTRLLEHIDKKTAVVAVSGCHWMDGTKIDLEIIGKAARKVGAALVIDGTQAVGALPIDVQKIKPDFLVTSCYKWLLGPFSMGFLYADPKHHDGEPLEYNWITREGSEDFTNLVHYTDKYQDGARRFDMGARNQINLMPLQIPALEQLLKWTPEEVQKTLATFTDLIEEKSLALGIKSVPKKLRVSHIIGIRFPRGIPNGLFDTLNRKKVFVSVRGDALRVSPHLYNTRDDVEALFDVLKKFF